ncbi:hypothetical protein [Schlesneria sp. DSM 10557]|uniref:hypothetical protein n=1 Tax=Schlesneria sp. DSM 10557 TaxID=3044399 RepID=UPI0035A1AE5F
MEQLLISVQNLLVAGWDVLVTLLAVMTPWTPLIAWVAFWLLAVNWEKLYSVLANGAVIGVALIGLMMILVWGLVAPPPDGVHHLFGLHPSNFVGKTVYITILFTIMALCGSVQLSGAYSSLTQFEEEETDDAGHADQSHGHHDHASVHHAASHDSH